MSRRRKGLDWEALLRAVAALALVFGGFWMTKGARNVQDIAFGLFAIILLTGLFMVLVAMALKFFFPREETNDSAPLRQRAARRASKLIRFVASPPIRKPEAFDWELLHALEWRSFEKLVAGYFRIIGFEAERVRAGADGGVDLVLRKSGQERVFAYVQCKAWNTYLVGIKPVRELFGVMAAESVAKGYFVCTGTFTPEATAFAQGKPLKLVSGQELLEKLTELPASQSHALLAEITAEDHTTPTCPSCDEKMVTRKGKDGTPFWGCRNFPKCWKNFPMAKSRVS